MPEIKRIPVLSSNIEGIGYDYEQAYLTSPVWATLKVWFTNGTVYEYYKVPLHEFEKMEKSDSIGKYFAANIKGKYDFKKV